MMSKTFNLLFYIRRPKFEHVEATVMMRITVDSIRAELSAQRSCNPLKWNTRTGRVNGSKEDARQLNNYLDTLQTKAYEIHRRMVESGIPITAQGMKERFVGVTVKPNMLLEVFLRHNEQMLKLISVGEYAKGTYKHFKTTYLHLRDFIPWKFKQHDVDVKRVDYDFIAEFQFYLKTEKKVGHNSTMKYLGDFKKIIFLCVKNDWLPKDPFMGFKLARKEVVRDYLLMEEVEVLANLELEVTSLRQVRDIFLFSCYTGLAYVDVKKLNRQEIQTGPDGHIWLFIRRQKSGTAAPVPLLPPCLEILERYRAHPLLVGTDYVLPVLSNQKMNAHLKTISKLSGIDKFLTYHLARHTFATSVTLNNNVPIESVMKMMGHKNLKQTQHYAKVLNRKVAEDMNVLRQKMWAASAST